MSTATVTTTTRWVRTALALALAGLLALLSGGVLLAVGGTASADPGKAPLPEQVKVAVCHRTASEGNPYVFIEVPEDEANGHITGTSQQHNLKITWKTDGTWRGVPHKAGDVKLDYYAHEDEIALKKCFDPEAPTPTGPEEVTPEPPTFSDTCDPDNEQLYVPASDEIVTYTTTQVGTTITVTATTADAGKYVLVGQTVWTFTVDDSPCPTTPTTTPTTPTQTPTTVTETPTVAPSTATQSPTKEATVKPTKEPTQEETEEPEVLPAEASQPPTAPQAQVPTTVDAGFAGWSTTELWGAALVGGGLALLVSSGAILVGVRKE